MSRQAYAEVWTFADPVTEFLKAAKNTEVHVYKPGTSEHATIYEQREGGSPSSNPFISQENGLILFWANTGDYDIKFHDTTVPARFGDYIVGWQSSPVNVEIEAGELSSKGEFIEWAQESGGAWLAKIKAGSVGKDRLKSALELPLSMLEPNIQQSLFSSGDIKPTARSSAPTGWLLCNGASLLRTEYASLFSAIGTAYGSADGTHFTLPNLQSTTPMGAGTGSGLTARTLGSIVGSETHTLLESEIPKHSHPASGTGGSLFTASGYAIPHQTFFNATGVGTAAEGFEQLANILGQSQGIIGNTAFQANGGGAHSIVSPSTIVNFLIKT